MCNYICICKVASIIAIEYILPHFDYCNSLQLSLPYYIIHKYFKHISIVHSLRILSHIHVNLSY